MSRPRHYWYGIVRKMIMQYPKLKSTNLSEQEKVFIDAINKAIADTMDLPDGALRVKAVKAVLLDKTKTYEGVAQELHYDWRTIQNWVNKFVNMVGVNAGY